MLSEGYLLCICPLAISFIVLFIQNAKITNFGILLEDKNITKLASEFHCLSLSDTSWHWSLKSHSISLDWCSDLLAMPNAIGCWAKCEPHALSVSHRERLFLLLLYTLSETLLLCFSADVN